MPRQSETGNVIKRCACLRPRRWSCGHPWYVDYKAPAEHASRPNERYRKNLDSMIGRHCGDLREAQVEARRAIVAWLDGRDPAELQPGDRPTLTRLIESYQDRPGASKNVKYQLGP